MKILFILLVFFATGDLVSFVLVSSDLLVATHALLILSAFCLLLEFFIVIRIAQLQFNGLYCIFGLFLMMVGITHLASALIFAFGLPVVQVVDINVLIGSVSLKQFILSNNYIGLSLFFLSFGASATLIARKSPLIIGRTSTEAAALAAGIIVFLIGLPAFAITSKYVFTAVRQYGYGNTDIDASTNVGTWFLQLSNFLPISGYFILCGCPEHKKKARKLGTFIIIVSTITNLLIGRRAQFIMPILAYYWIRKKRKQGSSFRLLYLIAAAFLIATPFIISFRNGDSILPNSATFLLIILASLNNLGTVYYYVPAILQNFPTRLDYTYFDSIVSAVAFCLPNIGSSNASHIGVDHGIVYWLGQNYFVNQATGASSVETGYTFIGEAYQSFGLLGLMFIFFLGCVLGLITKVSELTRDARYTAFFASLIGPLLFYTRDTFINLLRPVLWFSLPVLILSFYLARSAAKTPKLI